MVKVEALTKLDSTQFGFHVNENSTLQIINGISNKISKNDSNILAVQLFYTISVCNKA